MYARHECHPKGDSSIWQKSCKMMTSRKDTGGSHRPQLGHLWHEWRPTAQKAEVLKKDCHPEKMSDGPCVSWLHVSGSRYAVVLACKLDKVIHAVGVGSRIEKTLNFLWSWCPAKALISMDVKLYVKSFWFGIQNGLSQDSGEIITCKPSASACLTSSAK